MDHKKKKKKKKKIITPEMILKHERAEGREFKKLAKEHEKFEPKRKR